MAKWPPVKKNKQTTTKNKQKNKKNNPTQPKPNQTKKCMTFAFLNKLKFKNILKLNIYIYSQKLFWKKEKNIVDVL